MLKKMQTNLCRRKFKAQCKEKENHTKLSYCFNLNENNHQNMEAICKLEARIFEMYKMKSETNLF